MASNRVLRLVLMSPAVWLGTRMALARATSHDGHNDSSSSSGLPGVTRTPFKFIALRPANCLATACKCFSIGLQSCTTAGLPLQNCLPVSTSTTVTSESGPLARAGLPSPGPGSPSDPEGPCRRRHGRRGWRGRSRAGRPAGTTIDIYCNYVWDSTTLLA